jgi:hypothetical protein
MERIADRLLRRLELHAHEAVIVAHKDRAHAHMHLLVNRVHPQTGVAWDLSHDFRRIQAVLRETEREFGLREVPGLLAQLPDRVVPDRAMQTQGEFRQRQRGEAVFLDHVRAYAQEFRDATSWDDLDLRLARHGLHLTRKGQGLVVTDGTHTVKASRIARDLSLTGLERRYGISYDERHRPEHTTDFGQYRRDVQRSAYVQHLTAQHYDAALVVTDARNRADRARWAEQHYHTVTDAFQRSLELVYRDPVTARAAFDTTAIERGPQAAVQGLREYPEQLGVLQTTRHTRLGGLITTHDETAARTRASQAADAAQAWLAVRRPHVRYADDLVRDTRVAERRAAAARTALSGFPDVADLERAIAHQAQRLLPAEVQRAYALATAPQRVLVPSVPRSIRTALRDEEERER